MSRSGQLYRGVAIAVLALGIAACSSSGETPEATATEPVSTAESNAADATASVPEGTAPSAESAAAATETAVEEPATEVAEQSTPQESPAEFEVAALDPSVAACGPPGSASIVASAPATPTASGSLFDAAGSSTESADGRIEVEGPKRRNRFFRFGNPNAPIVARSTAVARRTELNLSSLAGTWNMAEGTPGCSCKVTFATDGSGLHPAQASGCSASGLDRLENWRLRGSEVVLLDIDRTLLGSLSSDDGQQFQGGLANGTRAILWR